MYHSMVVNFLLEVKRSRKLLSLVKKEMDRGHVKAK